MDFGMIAGLVVALIAILGGNVLEGGHLESLIGLPAFLIVIGGTIGAVLVQFPMATVKASIKAGLALFKPKKSEPERLVEELVGLAQLARK
ncbi:MAG TPA: hypothetical protein PK095_05925, partial [Myxococcota bacterium]|nr:hypothetical protein [Myxococcota bacterium]